jgi:hypothetical protein
MLGLLVASAAEAFCGFYVGPAGTVNSDSIVVVTHQDGVVTLTVASDWSASPPGALLLPVPSGAVEVEPADADLLRRIDLATAPRVVTYEPAARALPFALGAFGCGSDEWSRIEAPQRATVAGGVRFLPDALAADPFSTEEVAADQLDGWLGAKGWTLPPGGEATVRTYADAGVAFLAVVPNARRAAEGWMPPVRIRYASDAVALPLALGATASEGTQELLVVALSAGEVRVSNLPERSVPDTVEIASAEEAGSAHQAQLDAAFAAGGGWVTEYTWQMPNCDPCVPGAEIEASEWTRLGWIFPEGFETGGRPDTGTDGVSARSWPTITRLRLRYGPEEAVDLATYDSGISRRHQIRYVVGGLPQDGDTAADAGAGAAEPRGCTNAPRAAVPTLALAAGALLRRRRSAR